LTSQNDGSTLKLSAKDWIGIFSVLAIQATVIVGSWWTLADRVLVLEATQTHMASQMKQLVDNQRMLVTVAVEQKNILERINRLEEASRAKTK